MEQMAAKDYCADLDMPGSRWDHALLAIAMAACVPFIGANMVVLWHRKRRYFCAQGGALLILTNSIAGLIWIAATFVTNMHLPRKNRFLLICPLWSFWLQLTFGFWLWLACQALRLLHLQYLCQNASREGRMLGWALLLWLPGVAFSIIATATNGSTPRYKGHDCANCKLSHPWSRLNYILLASIYFGILIILLIYAKRNKDYMVAVEYSHTSEYSLMMALVIYLSYGAAVLTGSQKKIAGRCFLTFCVCFLVFINFWVRLGWPVYLCLFKGKSEMDSFEEELRSCGAVCLDQLGSATNTSQTAARSSSARQLGDWILRAIDAAMNDISDCKERISQLEQKKTTLADKIKYLESSPSRKYMPFSRSVKEI